MKDHISKLVRKIIKEWNNDNNINKQQEVPVV